MHGPIGANVSKPLHACTAISFFCRSRAVTSLTQVRPRTYSCARVGRHPMRAPADDDAQLRPRDRRGPTPGGSRIGVAGADDRVDGLMNMQRLGRQRLALLGGVVLVVQADADDLRRQHRREHADDARPPGIGAPPGSRRRCRRSTANRSLALLHGVDDASLVLDAIQAIHGVHRSVRPAESAASARRLLDLVRWRAGVGGFAVSTALTA